MLRGGATLGVLVVQNRARRTYSDEEIEALQTTAMLLAEMIVSGELQALAGQPAPIAIRRPLSVKGAPIAEGLGIGHAVLHQPRVVVSKIVADDVNAELERLETAIEAMRAAVDEIIDRSDDGGLGEHRDVLEAFRMIAHDRGWLRRLREAVASGLTAEAAVEKVQTMPAQSCSGRRIRTCAIACTISPTSPTGSCISSRVRAWCCCRANCRKTPSSWRAR